jgi:hypothetical protein
MGEMRNACNTLVGEAEGRIPLGRPRRRWEDNIRVDLGKYCGKMWTGFMDLFLSG